VEADGANLAACVQTILEIGDGEAFRHSIREALGVEIEVNVTDGPRFEVCTRIEGVLRPLRVHELSHGSLRYIALAAALFAPRVPAVAIFNEPESSRSHAQRLEDGPALECSPPRDCRSKASQVVPLNASGRSRSGDAK
jgi:predicted ATPase